MFSIPLSPLTLNDCTDNTIQQTTVRVLFEIRFNLRGEKWNTNLRGNVFTQRVVGIWNELPGEVVEADTITTCKRHLDRCLDRKGLVEYRQMGVV